MQPAIITPWDFHGQHGKRIEETENKNIAIQYQDLSVVAVVPTRSAAYGPSVKWLSAMAALIKPLNQKFTGPVFVTGYEVGRAYNEAIKAIREHKDLKSYRYMLAWEDDVIPQPDALIELLAVATETQAEIVGGLYWAKGEGGWPMIYGDAEDPAINFRTIHPTQDRIKWCYGTGMGFTLFRMDQFERFFPDMDDNWFVTEQKWDRQGEKIKQSTQDLRYMEELVMRGGKICVAQQAKAGHYDAKEDVLW